MGCPTLWLDGASHTGKPQPSQLPSALASMTFLGSVARWANSTTSRSFSGGDGLLDEGLQVGGVNRPWGFEGISDHHVGKLRHLPAAFRHTSRAALPSVSKA